MYEKLTERKTFRFKKGMGAQWGKDVRSDPLIKVLNFLGITKQGGVSASAFRKKPADANKTPAGVKGAVARGDLSPMKSGGFTFYVPPAKVSMSFHNHNPMNKMTVKKKKEASTKKRVRANSGQ